VRRGRRAALRAGQPVHARSAVGPLAIVRSSPSRRAARGLRSVGRGDKVRQGVLGRDATAARPRREPGRAPSVPVPGRADDRPGPAEPARVVGDDPHARGRRHDGPAHHAVPRRGRSIGRRDRRHRSRTRDRCRNAPAAQDPHRWAGAPGPAGGSGRPRRDREDPGRLRGRRRGHLQRRAARLGHDPGPVGARSGGPSARRGGHPRGRPVVATAEPGRGVPRHHRARRRGQGRARRPGRRPRRQHEDARSSITLAPVGRPNVVANTLTIARRNLLHTNATPEQLVEMSIQPIMFLVLFVYVFGGAIAGSSAEYLQFALPGILVQSVCFLPFTTAIALNVDFQRGVIDRFRSLPIARSAVIGGRILADGARIAWSILIITAFSMLLGFRFEGGTAGALGALLLVLAFGLVMCWPLAFIGITARTTESVNTWGFMIILPLTFASSAFAPVDTMPGWLQAFVNANPVTSAIDAARGLMLGGPVAEPVIDSVIWMIVIVAVFAPPAIPRSRRRLRGRVPRGGGSDW